MIRSSAQAIAKETVKESPRKSLLPYQGATPGREIRNANKWRLRLKSNAIQEAQIHVAQGSSNLHVTPDLQTLVALNHRQRHHLLLTILKANLTASQAPMILGALDHHHHLHPTASLGPMIHVALDQIPHQHHQTVTKEAQIHAVPDQPHRASPIVSLAARMLDAQNLQHPANLTASREVKMPDARDLQLPNHKSQCAILAQPIQTVHNRHGQLHHHHLHICLRLLPHVLTATLVAPIHVVLSLQPQHHLTVTLAAPTHVVPNL